MHKLFVSDGIVLGKRGLGEANTLVAILTRELGLVKAGRTQCPPRDLQIALQHRAALARHLLVHTRQARVEAHRSAWYRGPVALTPGIYRRASGCGGRIARLLLRLIPGEEESLALYDTVAQGLAALVQASKGNSWNAEHIETVLGIAHTLAPGLSPADAGGSGRLSRRIFFRWS